ncbi:MAG: DoxX family protein [Ginsengibacter sp.]
MKVNGMAIFTWALRIAAALIMLQTLYFKFTANAQSVKLFTILGMEPWGRIGTGVMELIASVLILIPRTTAYGSVLGLGLMSGAIYFHLTKLGIVFDGDAILFTYAVIVFVACALLTFIYRKQILNLISSAKHVQKFQN